MCTSAHLHICTLVLGLPRSAGTAPATTASAESANAAETTAASAGPSAAAAAHAAQHISDEEGQHTRAVKHAAASTSSATPADKYYDDDKENYNTQYISTSSASPLFALVIP